MSFKNDSQRRAFFASRGSPRGIKSMQDVECASVGEVEARRRELFNNRVSKIRVALFKKNEPNAKEINDLLLGATELAKTQQERQKVAVLNDIYLGRKKLGV